jgi:hypothetical protein
MAKSPTQPTEHLSPRREQASLIAQLFGVAAGPSAWIAQLVIGYGVSSYVCYPGDTPRRDLPGSGEHGLLLAINLACLAVALAGFAVSFTARRRLPAGDGRGRFLATCGLLSAATFSIAILFDTPSALALRLCWSAPS